MITNDYFIENKTADSYIEIEKEKICTVKPLNIALSVYNKKRERKIIYATIEQSSMH